MLLSSLIEFWDQWSLGLISMGLRPGVHSMVGIYSRNCPEWIVCEQGVYSYSMVLVPLYDSLGPDARSYVLSQCEMRWHQTLPIKGPWTYFMFYCQVDRCLRWGECDKHPQLCSSLSKGDCDHQGCEAKDSWGSKLSWSQDCQVEMSYRKSNK